MKWLFTTFDKTYQEQLNTSSLFLFTTFDKTFQEQLNN